MSQNQNNASVAIIVALIGLVGVIGAAFINSNSEKENKVNPKSPIPKSKSIPNSKSPIPESKSIPNNDNIKKEISTAIIEYLNVHDRAYYYSDIGKLDTIMAEEALRIHTQNINDHKLTGEYSIEKHRNIEIINYEIDPNNKLKATARVKAIYEYTLYDKFDICSVYIPETNLILSLTLKKINGDWKVINFSQNDANVYNSKQGCK